MMAFPIQITSVLTGATVDQLRRWRRGVLTPEISINPYLYSFRDLVALRTVVKLRTDVSLQAVRKALERLRDLDLTQHPSMYTLQTDGSSVYLIEDETATDLVKKPGQRVLLTLEDLFSPFKNFRGDDVVDFRRPRAHLQVTERRMAGWPTIEQTRIPYDNIAILVSTGEVSFDQVAHFYPDVGADAARDALSLHRQVEAVAKSAGAA